MKRDIFINNRKRLFDKLEDGSMVVLLAGEAPKKTADEIYPFTPNRNFYYITGINEEKHKIVLFKSNGVEEEILFIQKPDPVKEKWVGKTIRESEAIELSGIETVLYLEDFNSTINQKLSSGKVKDFYLDLERRSLEERITLTEEFAQDISKRYPYINIKNVYGLISELRTIKAPEEIEEMKKAIEITIEGVNSLMKNAKAGLKEYELEAYFDFHLKRSGVKDFAFKTIAAAGENATILHYVENNSTIKEDDLILFDLGAQYNYYNADITRTFPISGKFTDRQKAVYEAVLRVNEAIIDSLKPGVNFQEINNKATDLIAQECINLGLINDKKDVRNYYWHSIGHGLGLDTHDVGERNVELRPGMVYTVEPGIYIEEEGIGVRIEDDVLITENGNEVLTKDMIKSVEDIENFMCNR